MKIALKKVKQELAVEKLSETTLESFRISENLYAIFYGKCKKDGYSTVKVIEKLMAHYVSLQQ